MKQHQKRENLDILFRRTLPEIVLENLKYSDENLQENNLVIDIENYPFKAYERYSFFNFSEFSRDELQIRHKFMRNHGIQKYDESPIFSNLVEYADTILKIENDMPVCRIEEVLGWDSITKRLGQDLFVTAWLAWKHCVEKNISWELTRFDWPTILNTDNWKLQNIFERGLAENHFHLHGSTQSFALSWAYLMNNPEKIGPFFDKSEKFKVDLSPGIMKSDKDYRLSWKQRILYAAKIRSLLFSKYTHMLQEDENIWQLFYKFENWPIDVDLAEDVKSLQYLYGVNFKQNNKNKVCLDYAITNACYHVDVKNPNRLLAGERNFRRIF